MNIPKTKIWPSYEIPTSRGVRPHQAFDIISHADFGGWRLNGKRVRQRLENELDLLVDTERWRHTQCPYCSLPLDSATFHDPEREDDNGHLTRAYEVWSCGRCAFWEFRGSESTKRCMDAPAVALARSVALRCPEVLPEGCHEELAQYLRRDVTAWHRLSSRGCEELVADIFRANHAGCEVIHVGRPGDLGVDVVFIDSGKTRWLIQVKRRTTPGATEGFSTLQSILGTLVLENTCNGIVVTTADSFSAQACRERTRAATRGYTVEFYDKGILDRLVGSLLPANPWTAALRLPIFSGANRGVRAALRRKMDATRKGSWESRHRTNRSGTKGNSCQMQLF